jgi:secreted trypsin-like serine protease
VIIDNSGGPLVVYSNDTQQYELVGITSFRNVCISEGLFTRTAPFFDWISRILENPPPLTTLSTRLPVTTPTPKPDVHGKFQNVRQTVSAVL